MWEQRVEFVSRQGQKERKENRKIYSVSEGRTKQIAILKSKWITVINVDKVEMTGWLADRNEIWVGSKELLIEFNALCAIWPKLLRKFTSLTVIILHFLQILHSLLCLTNFAPSSRFISRLDNINFAFCSWWW